MIRHLIIVREDAEEQNGVLPVRAFFNIEKTDPFYQSTEVIIKNEDSRNALLAQAIGELKAFKRKYAAISEFAKLFATLENEIEQLSMMQ